MTLDAQARWDAKLIASRERLTRRAAGDIGAWPFEVLENGWEFAIQHQADGQVSYRFRRLNDGKVTWDDFMVGTVKLARVLGRVAWWAVPNEGRAYFERSFVAPADSPALSREGA